jgi:hypothetical protein
MYYVRTSVGTYYRRYIHPTCIRAMRTDDQDSYGELHAKILIHPVLQSRHQCSSILVALGPFSSPSPFCPGFIADCQYFPPERGVRTCKWTPSSSLSVKWSMISVGAQRSNQLSQIFQRHRWYVGSIHQQSCATVSHCRFRVTRRKSKRLDFLKGISAVSQELGLIIVYLSLISFAYQVSDRL